MAHLEESAEGMGSNPDHDRPIFKTGSRYSPIAKFLASGVDVPCHCRNGTFNDH